MNDLWNLLFHLDDYLREYVKLHGTGTYALLFGIIFAETGLVIAPLLPGDSLLFLAGTFCATDSTGESPLNVWVTCVLLTIAAILGDTVNYHFGRYLGPRVFRNPKSFWLNPQHLERTQEYFAHYGGKTIILARFLPVVRTMAPFVAGIGNMHYGRFLAYNVVGGFVWVFTFVLLGYKFAENEFVKHNFEVVTIGIVLISCLPVAYELLRHRFRKTQPPVPAANLDEAEVHENRS